jgi:hypothetical protein
MRRLRSGFFAGFEAAAVFSVLMAIGRLAGLSVNLELALGSLVTGAEGFGTWMLGFSLHLALGGVFGVLYALILDKVLRREDPLAGIYLGLVHAIAAGFLVGVLSSLLPPLPEVPPPGPFFAALGVTGVAYFLLPHVVFGLMVVEVLTRPLPGLDAPAAVTAGPR